jgi:exo-1,4-beta-D-glucosaminidase
MLLKTVYESGPQLRNIIRREVAMRSLFVRVALAGLGTALSSTASHAESWRMPLASGWAIQSSAAVAPAGDAISRPGFSTDGWHAATVPGTIVGALVEEGRYPNPYTGMNLRAIPGTTYPVGAQFALLPIPAASPYKKAWWYRREFDIPAASRDRAVWLHFNGINYRANIWVNGARIATREEVAGAFRRYEFDITRVAHPGARNAVAVEVFAPEPRDLAMTWVDWNPTPPDKNMGLWGDASVSDSGPVAVRHPHVITDLDLPSLDVAHLTVTTELWNTTDTAIDSVVRGAVDMVAFSRAVRLAPREHRIVRFSPADTPQLNIQRPRVWWPYRMGEQHHYTLAIGAEVNGVESDHQDVRFGVNEFTSELTDKGHRLFRVNGKPILIRGGGWASDMLLRPKPPARLESEFRYVKEMGLNTIRTEGKLETDEFYDLADREGILIMPGWCCCDQWELWDKWDAENYTVGPASLRDQLLRLRNHPSIFVWLNGSDKPPVAAVEQKYLDIERELEWSRPTLSSAAEAPGPVSGPSGVKMRGPYDYVPPSYWLTDAAHGGAFGFSAEIGPGAAVPPIESLEAMLPAEHLWPIDQVWNFHAGGGQFKDIKLFTAALEGRYGKAAGVAEYARKAQALAYEGERAMFEGYARNKYTSTGVIQWMLNNAWPSIIWHLYDYYLRPGGGYFGTKKACEPLHVQYSYDDRSVVIVNDTPADVKGLRVAATVLDFTLAEKFRRDAAVDIAADGVRRAFEIPALSGLTTTYFVRLALRDAAGRLVSRNFYWLSTRDDQLDWPKTQWYTTPTKRHGDLTALARLPPTTLSVSPAFAAAGRQSTARVTVANTGRALAFQIRLKLEDPRSGDEILPAFWDDNYFELLPGEERGISVSYPGGDRAVQPRVTAEAWNTVSGK